MSLTRSVLLLALLSLLIPSPGAESPGAAFAEEKKEPDTEEKKEPDTEKPPPLVTGAADVLRHVPKKFAKLLGADDGRVELHIEGEKEPSSWKLLPDAEIKRLGWWGRIEQFREGDRVWVWFSVGKDRKPRQILLLADEISEQDIHALPLILQSVDVDKQTMTVKRGKDGKRTLRLPDGSRVERDGETFVCTWTEPAGGVFFRAAIGDPLLIQTADDGSDDSVRARRVVPSDEIEVQRRKQMSCLREEWADRGLTGSVLFLHPLGGEMELMLDHEAIRWGRNLKSGDEVRLVASGDEAEPIDAVVKLVEPWRERTRLRLVVDGIRQSELAAGERVRLRVRPPGREILSSDLPPDLGRPRTRAGRIDWFLATVYCPCKVGGDRCTGMFYTLAGCNQNKCPMPGRFRKQIGDLIDKDLDDRAIFDELRKSRGPDCCRPHLLR